MKFKLTYLTIILTLLSIILIALGIISKGYGWVMLGLTIEVFIIELYLDFIKYLNSLENIKEEGNQK